MKYTSRVTIEELREKYQNIIAWGTGPIFTTNYSTDLFVIDYLVDGTGKHVGETVKGKVVDDISVLKNLEGKSIIILYTIYERQVVEQIKDIKQNIDLVVYGLIDTKDCGRPHVYAKNCEDILLYQLIRQFCISEIKFLEIGVCHPIMRNNTFLLHEIYSSKIGYKGVLVEANPICWDIIEEYRPRDILIKKGVGIVNGKLPFYMFPDLLGHSTFDKQTAEEKSRKGGWKIEELKIDVVGLSEIIEENFDSTPDILAIDAEGLDYDILKNWDSQKYPFKIIVSEVVDTYDVFLTLMQQKGYKPYAKTPENVIWYRDDLKINV